MYDENRDTQVRGDGVAVSGGSGSVATLNLTSELTLSAFQSIPDKLKLTITDVILYPQGDVTSTHTVNLAEQFPNGTHRILLQLDVGPGHVTQAHHHTGHVFGPKSKVIVFTDANGPANRHITVMLTGYLGPIRVKGVQKARSPKHKSRSR
jgi:hypothetical protein